MANFAGGLLGLLDVEGTLNNILGTIGLSASTLCTVPWTNRFKEVCIAILLAQRYYRVACKIEFPPSVLSYAAFAKRFF